MNSNSKIKRKVNRSAAYPGVSLSEAVDATNLLRENLGDGSFSRESAAQALGYSGVNGASSTKIAACAHFGLLSREGNAYRPSDLAQKIFLFVSEDEKRKALVKSVQKPSLYSKLIKEYNGSALPKMLSNILVRKYNITDKAADKAASNFEESVKFAGILHNGILNLIEDNDEQTQLRANIDTGVNDGNIEVSDHRDMNLPPKKTTGGDQNELKIIIPDTGIVIAFPQKYAYELSIGSFKTGIEELAKNAIGNEKNINDEQ